ncbi:unnamed protein product [Hyaloperonospora brassicae]|uniref:Uncharacterized protein n=1 Tax=Hyaloperonospora brassicae TaxID=162125 RepID=A0AAV0TD46_HYABA|nr:unnamed protein product [Hyaloperonospora brassicae]
MSRPQDLLPPWLVNHHVAHDSPLLPDHIRLIPWDDGFTPSGCNCRPGTLVRDYPRDHPGALVTVDHAVSERTADQLYASAIEAKVWGVYVSVDELLVLDAASRAASIVVPKVKQTAAQKLETGRQDLARQAIQEFLVERLAGQDVITKNDWARTHGVAVWVIASDCDDETEYHVDYAEQVRYETNVLFPPIYGATLHRETGVLEGGSLYVNVKGLDHYEKYGHKTRKRSTRLTTDELEELSQTEPGWERVPYVYRRGIVCDGELPHFSGRVRSLPTSLSSVKYAKVPVKRVIVGFNLFPSEIGACVAKFPEHSGAFNRYVKLSQAAVKRTKALSTAGNKGGWTLASVRANPKQAAFLKLLARRVRETEKQKSEAVTPTVTASCPSSCELRNESEEVEEDVER